MQSLLQWMLTRGWVVRRLLTLPFEILLSYIFGNHTLAAVSGLSSRLRRNPVSLCHCLLGCGIQLRKPFRKGSLWSWPQTFCLSGLDRYTAGHLFKSPQGQTPCQHVRLFSFITVLFWEKMMPAIHTGLEAQHPPGQPNGRASCFHFLKPQERTFPD